MSYTFSGMLEGVPRGEPRSYAHHWLRAPKVRALRDEVAGPIGGGAGDDIWGNGLCQLLATAYALKWGVPLVFALEEDGAWAHVAVLLPDGRTVDSEQYRASVSELVDRSVAFGGRADVVPLKQAQKQYEGYLREDEKAVLGRLVALVPSKPPKVGERGWV